MPIRNKLAVAVIAALGVSAAQANVIYNWQPESNTDVLATSGGRFVVSDDAYRSGAVDQSYDVEYGSVPDDFSFPESPIIEASLDVDKTNFIDGPDIIAAYPRQGFGSTDAAPNPVTYYLDADVTFVDDSFLGSLELLSTYSGFQMTSADNGLWTISSYDTDADAGGPCGSGDGCGGATGRWVLDAASVPTNDVPEPSSWGLFGLGLMGMVGVWRRRRRA